MRSVIFERFGEPAEVLKVVDRPVPEPGAGQVRVRMIASPVNPSDLMTIRGTYGKRPDLPAVPGYEGVGIVEASNAGLFGKFLLSKRVAVLNSVTGNWQDQVIAAAKSVIPIPGKVDDQQAAMFFVNPATAYLLTRKLLAVPQGQWLLQSAAHSAVGKMVIRLGQRFDFRTVNVVRNAAQVTSLKELGADAVVSFDPKSDPAEQLIDQVREVVGSTGVKHAIDPVGGAVGSAMIPCLGEQGRLIAYGTLSSEPLSFSARHLMTTGSRVEGFWLSRYMATQGLLAKLKLIGELGKLIQAGVLSSQVDASFPLDQVCQAVTASEAPGKSGKVLLTF
ncbi:zinc-binding dehydrogenase [bacterium]|nr:zinc-binding dehydrogenase [bacterium]